ncbi:hypothetical protein J4H89_23515 (plasmid) [Ralstonia solanacearum]|nr:hypothetical protein J4H89_23515 [Ralstonia solanacearum]
MIPLQDVPSPTRRARRILIAAAAGWLAFSVLAVVAALSLSRQDEIARTRVQDAQAQKIVVRVSALERQTEAVKRQPATATQTEVASARQALETRLTQLEQAQSSLAPAAELAALNGRVGALETSQSKASQASAVAARRPAARPKPKAPEPPFQVVGVELRGGERFLTISPPKSTALNEVRLLREGAVEGPWQLQSIEAHAAVFRVNGQPQRVPLP